MVHGVGVDCPKLIQLCGLCQHEKVVNAVDINQQNNHDMHQEIHVALV